MALSSRARPLLLLALLLAALSPACCDRAAASARRRALAPATSTPTVSPGSAWQEFHVAPPALPRPGAGGVSKNGGAAPRPVREWRRRARRGRGGGTGAWTFSAMLPRGFVPPSGSSACHNDMPATAADAQFFACSGAGTP
ncbi:unnamed protein product [Urochloa decumbens]|uniref:Uncharacterized protein n=1 Tax=Urochloa decumbens TaxID=240449 RepID=A0ABC9DY52_9POAL